MNINKVAGASFFIRFIGYVSSELCNQNLSFHLAKYLYFTPYKANHQLLRKITGQNV